MAKPPTTAAQYRKRADAMSPGLQKRTRKAQGPMRKKQKALNDMADNEEWLAGKIKGEDRAP